MTPSSPSSSSSTAIIAIASSLATAIVVSILYHHRHQKADEYEERIAKLEETRQAERTGRIRAEMKLRTCLKNNNNETNNTIDNDTLPPTASDEHNLNLECIGTIISPYTKRMGTPRQGQLVPSGRGRIQLRIPCECVDGLELYSHAWILFTFHANTDTPTAAKKSSKNGNKKKRTNNNNIMMNLPKTKIRPPRAPKGIKVGMLATRSPHRPNNIGLSLVQIVSVDKKNKQVHISALDLVNGTPVYDIKPCIPWDIPGYYENKIDCTLSVPTWVNQDDELKSVQFTNNAHEALDRCIRANKLGPLYTRDNDGMKGAIQTIKQILAQDPRASNSNGPNQRGSSSSSAVSNSNSAGKKKNDVYKMILCCVEVEFSVDDNGVVNVENVNDNLDLENVEHVDGIPILLK